MTRSDDGVRPGSTANAPGAWTTMVYGWHAAMLAVVGLGLLSLAVFDDLSTGQRVAAAIAFAVLGLTYAALMLRRDYRGGRAGLAYLALAIVVTCVLCAIHPGLSLVLFLVYPQMWVFTDSRRGGVIGTVLLSVSATTGFVLGSGGSWQALARIGPQMAISLIFSILLGMWIYRIIDQSLERAQLIAELAQTREELAEAHRAQGAMAERERMAREIHDTLAQGFTSVIMLAQAAAGGAEAGRDAGAVGRRLAAIEDVARENLAEARSLVSAFAAVGLQDCTLPEALRRLAARFAAETGVAVEVDVADSCPLPQEQQVVLLRAVQEALTNVRRHAEAGRVVVRLRAGDDSATVEVGDDGVGFATATARRGFGLAGMRERVSEVGGDVDVASDPGRGTRVVVRLPAGAT